jgi:hypothetical protein
MKNNLAIPVAHVLKTAAWVSRLAYLIALIGVAGSYSTQVGLLLDHEVGGFSYVLPATIDFLAVCAALALQLQGLDRGSRKIAGWILTVAVVVSVAANVTGGHNTIARLAHAWPVIAYLLGELLANRVRAFAARLAAAQLEPATASAPDFRPRTEPVVDTPEAIAYRQAQAQASFRRASALPALNGKTVAAASN